MLDKTYYYYGIETDCLQTNTKTKAKITHLETKMIVSDKEAHH